MQLPIPNTPFGQVVIMMGGVGSGKSYISKNYLPSTYKIIDADALHPFFIKSKLYPEHETYDSKDPSKVSKLHLFIIKSKIRKKLINTFFSVQQNNKIRLPNVIFDVSGSSVKQIEEIASIVISAGYQLENIHLIFVISHYKISLARNSQRQRTLADSVVKKTGFEASQTFLSIIDKRLHDKYGSSICVLNNCSQFPEYVKLFKNSFKDDIERQVRNWIKKNIYQGGKI